MQRETDRTLVEVLEGLVTSGDLDVAMASVRSCLARHGRVDGLLLNYQDALGTIYCLGAAGPFVEAHVPDARAAPLMLLHPAVAGTMGAFGAGVAAGCPNVAIHNAPHPAPIEAAFRAHFPTMRETPSLLSLNLSLGGEVLGSLEVVRVGARAFGPDDARRYASLEAPFALALHGARRERELRELRARVLGAARDAEVASPGGGLEDVIGARGGLSGVMEMVRRVARLSVPVLLRGETGTGKEVIARAIHAASPRASRPMVRVQCGAIPESLIDSELFGHEKGAFTGAVGSRRGRFELADGGTIFLDEIGELSPAAQVKFLRVLQEREVERLGDHRVIQVDVRVIAATHRDLEAMIREGTFREDLYYRLSLFPIELPPLRARRGDLHALASHFLRAGAEAMALERLPTLSAEALASLEAHDWPGNVRELRNAVERALILHGQGPLRFDLPRPLAARCPEVDSPMPLPLDALMTEHIRRVLDECGGRVEGAQGAAQRLGVHPSTLRARMRKLGVAYGRKRLGG